MSVYVSVCLSVIPFGAFCAARLQSPTQAFDSAGLKHMAHTFLPWYSLRVGGGSMCPLGGDVVSNF